MKHNNILYRTLSIVFAMLVGNTCFAQGPFNVGTIHPGDSIVIYYEVTINNPLVPPNAVSISNQGTVNGSNFGSVLTNDPGSPAGGDATLTLLNTPLPVVFSEFIAYQKEHSVALTWKIVTEENAWKYEVEKSADARVFKKIGEVFATGGNGIINYGFTDESVLHGNNYYRLKALDLDQTFTYTRIVKVSTDVATSGSNLYPNPVTRKSFNLQLLNLVKGQYELTLINTAGQIIYTKKVGHPGGTATHLISIPEHVMTGVYSSEIKGDNMTINKKLVIE
ncbi:T9SS type A sorting domain-containing protein [Dyadobacter sp. MSC1_007]|jgi:hypothetical protein|uniref:T9SS type A sorting domain-containing protein n=1 Tax=Dyadobacter sp. MSC1_007 TaxID=2909264 RepID=UPI00202E0E1C|nr:T9SS type A sorting domain-containing protein [Dyadobacter sp. MSC1_007]